MGGGDACGVDAVNKVYSSRLDGNECVREMWNAGVKNADLEETDCHLFGLWCDWKVILRGFKDSKHVVPEGCSRWHVQPDLNDPDGKGRVMVCDR